MALGALVGIELALGIATLIYAPISRRSGWLPIEGTSIYLVHSVLGLPLALGGVAYLFRTRAASRIYRLSGRISVVGVAFAGVGGLLTISHPLRVVGLLLMLMGPMTAGFGYAIPR
jgi:uncharacterized membrane protein